jgi:ABC-type bacteriocin/lantibiotic exporter with double-glycine peptidase domain
MIAGLVLNIIALATPLFIMMVYDKVISSQAINVLPFLTLGVGMAIVAEGVFRFIRSRSLSWLGGRLDNIVSNRIFEHLLSLPPSAIERASIPSQIARIKTFESIRDFFSGSVFMSVMELPFVIIALLVIGAIAGPLVLVPLACVSLYCLLFFVIWRKVRVMIRHAAKASSARQQFTLDTFEKSEAIRASGLEKVWGEKFRDLSGREAVAQFQLGWLGIMGETFANALTVLSAVAVIGFGVHLVWSGGMSTGALVATMILVWRVLSPFYAVCTMIPRLEQLRNSVRQVNSLMDIDSEEMAASGLATMSRISGAVSFNNVSIRYNQNDDPIVSNLSFEAKPGDIVAITGENGSGKTTILKMAKGLYLPQAGNIRLDGFDIRQINPHDIRRHIAYIPQIPDFFEGTVAENLRFGNPLATDGEIKQALGQARVLEDVISLPRGLQTPIGGRDGIRLSSSLELRLSMVRAYLQEAPILLIDEQPNSILNDEAGRFLHDTILRQRGRQTIFIVTYREDFLSMASTIIFLRRGLPVQVGSSDAMLERLKHMQW